MAEQTSSPKSFWFVGAAYGTEDQTERFLKEGIWQNGHQDEYLNIVRTMKPGDRIAIKSLYKRNRERDLPFDNKGHNVSVMDIKAIGVITHNYNDGRFIKVDWQPRPKHRKEWYFYTYFKTIWRLHPNNWKSKGLIDFAFNDTPQDIDRFRNAPYWKERFGDAPANEQRFKWTKFYEEFADKLIDHKDRRKELVSFISKLADKFNLSYIKNNQLDDICPFTVFGLFNRGMKDENREAIARDLADYLVMKEAVPKDFSGVPTLNNQQSWFFGFEHKRQPSDIDTLWDFFAVALQFSDSDNPDAGDEFSSIYDQVAGQYGVGWNLTMGLYWMRPWNYVTLDGNSQLYISNRLMVDIGKNGPKGRCNSKDYLKVLDELKLRFEEDTYPVHSFPELSLAALQNSQGSTIFEQQVEKFKLAFPDFRDFHDSGNRYQEIERGYKAEAIEQFRALSEKLTPNCDNAIEILLQTIELANFFNWRDKQHIQGLCHSEDFARGIVELYRAARDKQFNQKSFEAISSNLLKARINDEREKDSKLAANMFLQLIVFIPFFFEPKKYFAMKSSYMKRLMLMYGVNSFKKGSYINYGEFEQIQRFGQKIRALLDKYKPQDYIDVQSFLWIAENFTEYVDEIDIDDDSEDEDITYHSAEVASPTPIELYTIDDILQEGFVDREFIENIITQLRRKKNIILQGPPGTGKTWLAKKLGYALMGQKNDSCLRAVQFHPNLSYEDFVRGWRPSGEGKLTLVDGPFLEMVDAAKKDASIEHVIVIEEINRGNPAQIFGEMLTLLEDNKRTPNEALELSYRKDEFERIHIPANLYVIGTMNIADRSLALVDLALRRRFAFFSLQPTFGEKWRDWVHAQAGIDIEFLRLIGQRLDSLNEYIAKDRNLGSQFKIGHSYVTPSSGDRIEDVAAWFLGIVETEIGPLLEEYFFDDIGRVDKLKDTLVEGI